MAQTLTFERWHWGPEAAEGLNIATGRDADTIAAEVAADQAQLWRVNEGRAWLVTRAEGPELVIVCLQGQGAAEIIHHLRDQAKRQGFQSMRAHTQRRGLLRMFESIGAYQREIVIGLEL